MKDQKISDREFVKILKSAIQGNLNDTYKIIEMYKGLIVNNAMIDGKFNQECKDYIEEQIIKKLKKFKKI